MINIAKAPLQIHEAAVEALKNIAKPSDFLTIYNYIKEHQLFEFGAKKEAPEQILRKIIERKCVNSNLSYKTKELLFYKKDNKYGLIEWLSSQEAKQLYIESDKELVINKELDSVKDQLHKAMLEIEKLKNVNFNSKDFDDKFNKFTILHNEDKKQHNEVSELFKNFTSEKEKVVSLLKALKGNKHQLNVAKLDKGFVDLLEKKEKKKETIFLLLKIFGSLILVIPLVTIISILIGLNIDIKLIIPLLTIEIFLVYYFRITLHNYNSIDEQMLQVETKSSLLEFISDYMEYKQENKIGHEDISKFEDIIFSKISPDMKTVPTSPDVVSLIEKIAKIIKTK